MTDNEKIRVYSYSSDDDKVFIYNFTERELQETATIFTRDIWFFMDSTELMLYLEGATTEEVDNLKNDFIWFQPGVNKRHVIQCTCGKFLESGHSMDKLAKLGFKHHKRTGHTINLRGN